jgi:xylose isomerase
LQRTRFAARLNAFKAGAEAYWPGRNRITTHDLLARAATVPGLNAVDLNYPDHLADTTPGEMRQVLERLGLTLNGFAMRYYGEPGFSLGAFSHPDPAVRCKAIDLTKRGIDALSAADGRLMTLWLGQDGFDYPFQVNYAEAWTLEVEGIRQVASHNPDIDIAIEYKPNEPRAFSLISDIGTTLLAIREAGNPNLGVTLDFAHVLYAQEMPAFAAMLAARHSRLLGIHLNDGYGKRDDGLMVAGVNPVATVELLYVAETLGYDSAIYFDTFPDASGIDPVAECTLNIETVTALRKVVTRLRQTPALAEAMARQDAITARRIVNAALAGE